MLGGQGRQLRLEDTGGEASRGMDAEDAPRRGNGESDGAEAGMRLMLQEGPRACVAGAE